MKFNAMLFCFLFAVTANSFTTAKAQVNIKDSLALVDLYNSTNGKRWYKHTNWLTRKPVSTWLGITVTENRVTSLNLSYDRLAGDIPTSIGDLTALTYLNLAENYFPNGLPSSIGNLVNLQFLYIEISYLGGSLPASIGKLKSLQILNLSYNPLTGSIPASIGNLSILTYLRLDHCYLSGAIPSTIGNLSSLINLDLNTNHLTGKIPSTLYKLKKLSYLNVEINELTESENIRAPASIDVRNHFIVRINNNKFTFNGIEAIKNRFRTWVQYYSQDTILPIHLNGNALSVSAGGTLSNNTYNWFKAGEKVSTIIQGDSTFQPTQSGKYYAHITNAQAKYLTLTTDTISYTMAVAQTQNSISNVASVKTLNTHFFIYPNPAKDIIHIGINGTATIILTNSAGKILLTKTINNLGEINVITFANGTYYIQNKTTGETEKIILMH